MIEARGLCKSFDGGPVLNGLDLHVPDGAVYGLVGPNGAGKSTLIRILAGIYKQDRGEALIQGQPIFDDPAVKVRVGYIPDEIFFFSQATSRILSIASFFALSIKAQVLITITSASISSATICIP